MAIEKEIERKIRNGVTSAAKEKDNPFSKYITESKGLTIGSVDCLSFLYYSLWKRI